MIFFTVMIKGRAGKRKEILQTIHGVLDRVKKKKDVRAQRVIRILMMKIFFI